MLFHKFKQHFFARFGHYLLVMLVSSWIMLGNTDPSAAQPPRTVTWQDLQPEQTLNFQTALGHLSHEQLGDLATLARIRWWLEEGQINNASEPEQPNTVKTLSTTPSSLGSTSTLKS